MKFIYVFVSISFFSCSNPTEERNAKLSEFLIKQRNLQSQMDSINKVIDDRFPVDTLVLGNLEDIEQYPELLEAYPEVKKRNDLKIHIIAELNSLKFSMDSLSQMK